MRLIEAACGQKSAEYWTCEGTLMPCGLPSDKQLIDGLKMAARGGTKPAKRRFVTLTPDMARGLSQLGMGAFTTAEPPERMAWMVHALRHVPESEDVFPHGKWATILTIEGQVDQCAHDSSPSADSPMKEARFG